ncbi:MAG: hypothetical protein IJR00_06875 [Lachnospiraceae bacterium]|nr:hypothetical protein [Lachnospiraceae bacterium]
MKNFIKNFWQDESGMGTIEVILIIVVLIGLVIVFKKEINGIVQDVVNHIKSDAQSVYN